MAANLTLTGPLGGTINLNDGINYALMQGWRPNVAPWRRSRLAGGGPFADIRENIPLRVFGSSEPNALAALLALIDAADQGARWRMGEQIGPVLLNYRMSGSNLSGDLSVPIWNTVDEAALQLSPTFNEDINAYEISPVYFQLWRPGQWLGAAETPAATSAATHPNVFGVTFASDVGSRLQPLNLKFSGFSRLQDASGNPLGLSAYLLTAGDNDRIRVLEAESGTVTVPGSGTFNTAVDGDASGGNIRRLQPVSAGSYTLRWSSLNFTHEGHALYIPIVVLRNNSASISYQVQASVGTFILNSSPAVTVDTSSIKPRVIQLPAISYEIDMQALTLTITPSATSGSGNQLDVDACVLLQVVSPADRVVLLERINYVDQLTEHDVEVDSRVLTHPKPVAQQYRATPPAYQLGHKGDLYLLTSGQEVAACLVGTSDVHWRPMNGTIGSSPTAVSSTMTATRRLAYRVPQ